MFFKFIIQSGVLLSLLYNWASYNDWGYTSWSCMLSTLTCSFGNLTCWAELKPTIVGGRKRHQGALSSHQGNVCSLTLSAEKFHIVRSARWCGACSESPPWCPLCHPPEQQSISVALGWDACDSKQLSCPHRLFQSTVPILWRETPSQWKHPPYVVLSYVAEISTLDELGDLIVECPLFPLKVMS